MEFLGRTVKKGLHGRHPSLGVVRSYDSSSGLFEIVYEDGETKALDFTEMVAVLEEGDRAEDKQLRAKSRPGRRPKKRRRIEKKLESVSAIHSGKNGIQLGGDNMRFMLRDDLVENFRNIGATGINLGGGVGWNHESGETLDKGGVLNVTAEKSRIGLHSSVGLDLNLNEACDSDDLLNVYVDNKENLNKKSRGDIDLNQDANCDTTEIVVSLEEIGNTDRGFDLNMEVVEDCSKDYRDTYRCDQRNESCIISRDQEMCKLGETNSERDFATGDLNTVHAAGNSCLEFFEDMRNRNDVSAKRLSGTKVDVTPSMVRLAESDSKSFDGSRSDHNYTHGCGRAQKKRRRVLVDSNLDTETGLRRSKRAMSARTSVANKTSYLSEELSPSPAVSGLTEEKPVGLCGRGDEEPSIVLPKLQLPPSSQNLNVSGASLLDVFSIYAFLRSFSTMLFLSPFELEEFVESLNCDYTTTLFDSIHVSILQTLRKHVEHLSSEGDICASDCLRSLNWDLLDMITWPIFMVEYLLFFNSGLEPSLHVISLMLLKEEYCKQTASVKVTILRCLCDDLLDVEAVRLELNRRSLSAEVQLGFSRNGCMGKTWKKRASAEASDGLLLNDEHTDVSDDWNSDECCLCKMDGELLCCDGCPAAYHAKCVGVASNVLPEGNWYCPECTFYRQKPTIQPRRLLRGAELLGSDSHGRQYFDCCSYLLVFDATDPESYRFYHPDDVNLLLGILKSSGDGIMNTICKNWDLQAGFDGSSSNMDPWIPVCMDAAPKYANIKDLPLSASGSCGLKKDIPEEEHLTENLNKAISTEALTTTVEGADVTGLRWGKDSGKQLPIRCCTLASKNLEGRRGSDVNSGEPHFNLSLVNEREGCKSSMSCKTSYWNRYGFAKTVSLIAEEFLPKLSDGKVHFKSYEDIISWQVKTILKKSNKFCWSSIHNLKLEVWKEKCGWCFPCKAPGDAGDLTDCLFNMIMAAKRNLSETEYCYFHSKNKKGHLIDVACQMISVERRLRGLLLGPWLDPRFSKLWCESVLKASNVSCLTHLLLTLESSLLPRAFSADWLKHVDHGGMMGSALHFVIASRPSAKNSIARRRSKSSGPGNNPTANTEGGLSMCWWRGGRLSRQIFSWKALPHTLALKAARQAGCIKIPGVFYPENSEPARRSKRVAWQAAVCSSARPEQLALQIRELDSNIRWDDIENTHPLPALDKEARKTVRLFKKAIVRRKCSDGSSTRYLLDFGKRRTIPDVVRRNGSVIDESSSERKKYWLNETYVPLHLVKSFEDKRIGRKIMKSSSAKLSWTSNLVKRYPKKRRGLSYLFSRAEAVCHWCGQCNMDVSISQASHCQHCKGLFHKRHIGQLGCRKTRKQNYCEGGSSLKAIIKSAKVGPCRGRKLRNFRFQRKKHTKAVPVRRSSRQRNLKLSHSSGRPLQLQEYKKAAVNLPLRRSTRKIKYTLKAEQYRTPVEYKSTKQKQEQKFHDFMIKRSRKGKLCGKRTRTYSSYWLNGLRLSRKPGDTRVMQFRKDRHIVASVNSQSVWNLPICALCAGARSSPGLSCIACEICGEWFHGNAFGLNNERVNFLIGFRCHICRKLPAPSCSQMLSLKPVRSCRLKCRKLT